MSRGSVSKMLVLLLLCGCAPKQVQGEIIPVSREEEIDVSEQNAIAETIMETLGNQDEMTRIKDRMMIGMLLDGDASLIDGGVLYLAEEEDNADAVGVFDTQHLQECRQHIQDYLKQQKLNAEYYSPDEAFKVSNAVVVDNEENRIILIIHKDIASAQKIAQTVVKKTQ